MEKFYNQLLANNKQWVQSKLDKDPEYFKKLARGQKPPVLWIGCADSRVPANEIIGAEPGDVFVHRNIANMVVHSVMNMLSVLDYAVNVLEVKHIIVCGHYGCGGVQTAMTNKHVGLIDNWIRHIKDVYRFHQGHPLVDQELSADLLDHPHAYLPILLKEFQVLHQVHRYKALNHLQLQVIQLPDLCIALSIVNSLQKLRLFLLRQSDQEIDRC